ncbi:helix-turn-helix domain-containing protein [Pseudomonas sp. GX19020]|uniref:helix-turn-helix domain-containing protein n=1 Tax=Pseudomonas sp. GX19020 TaxID=2942277 RepID=UPI002018A00F|nr:helix-turn-helix domain-containing protein [Pseudomonas sp. GX19020]MCL4068179.1 helix-turn-helix domain-containing protein [Pseudomonas sp. GX19020]
MGKHAPISYQPRLLGSQEAATYLGVSETTLRALEIPRRIMGGRKLFDRLDLDRYASELPYEGDKANADEVDLCDQHFGLKR